MVGLFGLKYFPRMDWGATHGPVTSFQWAQHQDEFGPPRAVIQPTNYAVILEDLKFKLVILVLFSKNHRPPFHQYFRLKAVLNITRIFVFSPIIPLPKNLTLIGYIYSSLFHLGKHARVTRFATRLPLIVGTVGFITESMDRCLSRNDNALKLILTVT